MAPIYPAIVSVVLSALPRPQHAAMTGLIVVASALGGTTGSMITGLVFGSFGGQTAFYLSLLPMAAIAVTLWSFQRAAHAAAEVRPVTGSEHFGQQRRTTSQRENAKKIATGGCGRPNKEESG